MGIIEAFSKDDRVEIKVIDLIAILQNNATLKAQNEILLNATQKHIDDETVLELLGEESLFKNTETI